MSGVPRLGDGVVHGQYGDEVINKIEGGRSAGNK